MKKKIFLTSVEQKIQAGNKTEEKYKAVLGQSSEILVSRNSEKGESKPGGMVQRNWMIFIKSFKTVP